MSEKKIPLVEMFGPTIQGEGSVIGQQTYFLRFGLCDYKCKMCDSLNAVDPHQVKANAEFLTQQEILDKFLAFHKPGSTRWITLSGGNPCIHDLQELASNLLGSGFKLAVETQGTFHPDWLHSCDVVTVSPKGPGMGEDTDLSVLDAFMRHNYCHDGLSIKVVVFDQRDLEFAKMLWERYSGDEHAFYLSLGNPFPPTVEGNVRDPNGSGSQVRIDHFGHHIPVLITKYKMLFEDIKHDSILSQMKFLPQWHTFVWGNEKGK